MLLHGFDLLVECVSEIVLKHSVHGHCGDRGTDSGN